MTSRYTLTDWLIDVLDKGQCLSCRGFALERMGEDEAQCYSCGRWHCGYDLGRAYSDLIHDSTAYQMAEIQRRYSYSNRVQTADSMHFEDSLTQTPEVTEIVCDTTEIDI